jgi:pseudouridine synthase
MPDVKQNEENTLSNPPTSEAVAFLKEEDLDSEETVEFVDEYFDEEDEELEAEASEVPSGPSPDAERVSKLIAKAGIASRRAAEELITQGRVSINGHFITEPGVKADPAVDRILVDGRQLRPMERGSTVVLLHKPRNVMTTRSDPGGRPTVFNLLPHKFAKFHTVGRLDFDTSGVLLLTDDGELTHLLTHPSHGAEKVYEARVRGQVSEATLNALRRGIQLDDGMTAPARVKILAQREKNALIEIAIREGRNRQVRRMLEAVGHPVSVLRRVSFAGVELEGLPAGEHRVLLKGEVHELRKRVENKLNKGKRKPAGHAKAAPSKGPGGNAKAAGKPGAKSGAAKGAPKPAAKGKAGSNPAAAGGEAKRVKPAPKQSPLAKRVAAKWKE